MPLIHPVLLRYSLTPIEELPPFLERKRCRSGPLAIPAPAHTTESAASETSTLCWLVTCSLRVQLFLWELPPSHTALCRIHMTKHSFAATANTTSGFDRECDRREINGPSPLMPWSALIHVSPPYWSRKLIVVCTARMRCAYNGCQSTSTVAPILLS